MVKITLKVDGMACGMCESHVNDAVRRAFKVKKVASSHTAKKTEIISDAPLDEAALKAAIEGTGYKVLGIQTEPYQKKGFLFFGK